MGDPTKVMNMDTTALADSSTSNILPSQSDNVVKDSVTNAKVGQTTLFSSYDDPFTDSSQFPMQHATKMLPGDQIPIATTDPVTFTSEQGQGQTSQTQSFSGSTQKKQSDLSVTDSVGNADPSNTVQTSDNAKSVISSKQSDSLTIATNLADKTGMSESVTGTTASGKELSGATKSYSDSIVPTDSTVLSATSSDTGVVVPSSSGSSTAMSGQLPGLSTAAETTFSSAAVGLDSVSLKTTSAVPVPPLTGKPLVPEASGDSTILGGGLPDIIIYAGVPLCGLLILILLIVCIICIRRRKAKAKGSPAKNRVQDLWVNNSRSDVPLTSRSTAPEPNGGEAIVQDDIENKRKKSGNLIGQKGAKWRSGETNMGVRKRKVKKENRKGASDGQKGNGIPEADKGCTTYEAVFDYKGELSTHLQLKQGDLVRVHRKEAAGWWRGTVEDQTGWFPSNYVQPAPPDNFKTENEVDLHEDSHINSFLLKKTEEPNQRHSYIVNEPNHRKSTPTEEEIRAEPIYCKIQPKDKRKSGADRSNSTTPTKSDVLAVPKDTAADTDNYYEALYPFVARVETELSINKGDLILCKECLDEKGWMRGISDQTKQEGWVPATYVKKVEKVEKPQLDPDPTSYKELEVNTNMDDRPDLVGIVHRAVHTFFAEKAGDLEFETGDLITVFQVLENGWWLGCKDKTVGWFPGTFVEMIDQPSSSPSPSPASSNRSPSQSPVPSEDTLLLSEETGSSEQKSDIKPPTKSKLKPVRKAPAPPISPKSQDVEIKNVSESPSGKKSESEKPNISESSSPKKHESRLPMPGGSRLPKMSRPKVAPPLPPTKTADNDDESPLYDVIDKNERVRDMNKNISDNKVPNENTSEKHKHTEPTSDGLYELIKHPEGSTDNVSTSKRDKVKPPVPKRYIKPKLVTVPKTEVQMPNKESLTKGLVSGDVMILRSPPPPRPVAPKLGPIRAKLAEPKPLEDQIPSEEEDTFFNITPQRKFDAFVCQELSDHEAECEKPYQSLSSFGSFGVSTFGKPKEIKSFHQGEANDTEVLKVGKNEDNRSYDKPEILNAQVYAEREKQLENKTERFDEDQNVKQKDIKKDIETSKPVENTSKKTNVPEHHLAGSEAQVKTGIPVTPKVSRLPPPKSVSIKASESPVTDSDKIAGSPSEKPSKLQKPSKLVNLSSSKIPLSPKDSPKRKIEDSHVFQYPEESFQKSEIDQVKPLENVPNDLNLNNIQKSKDSNSPSMGENERPKTESFEKRQGLEISSQNRPKTDILECSPSTESVGNRQRKDSYENRQGAETVENRPRAESLENRPRAESLENRPRTDSLENRTRTDSIGKPPVAPKPKSGLPKLSKPKACNKIKEDSVQDTAAGKSPGEDKGLVNEKAPTHVNLPEIGSEVPSSASPGIPIRKTRLSESESDTDNRHVDDKSRAGTPGTKIPLGSAITHQSPKSRGRKSNIPSPGIRNKSSDRSDRTVHSQKISESESDGQISPGYNLQQKPESPRPGRKPASKQVSSTEKESLRNRSNSPAGRTGIPTKLSNRSNSPAPKQAGIPVPVSSGSQSSKSTPKNKQRGLVPPKKILNGQEPLIGDIDKDSNKHPESPGSTTSVKDTVEAEQNDSTSPKPDRPSKPPRVQKQKSKDGKPPKHGKSLLPVIHKSMEIGSSSPNGVSQTTPGTKPKRGIPVAKTARSPAPASPPADYGEEMKRTLYQAVRGYTAQIDGELTFSEGTFVKELSDCDRPGWYVGMLADGTTGLYPADHFKPSPVSAQSEA